MTKRFADVHLALDTVRGRAGQGGPVGGAVAEVLAQAPVTPRRRRFARGRQPARLVIEAPTWRLDREITPGSEQEARQFADDVNSASHQLATRTWWPIAG